MGARASRAPVAQKAKSWRSSKPEVLLLRNRKKVRHTPEANEPRARKQVLRASKRCKQCLETVKARPDMERVPASQGGHTLGCRLADL